MALGTPQRERTINQRLGMDADRALDPLSQPRRRFCQFDDERIALPAQPAWPHGELIGIAHQRFLTPLGHRPATLWAVERDVQRNMIKRLGPVAAGIIRREHRSREGNDGQAVSAIIAEGVDIPPGIAALRKIEIEARSAISARAAARPESAAIGTPAPGCALPPAQ